jgi:hypothetical protein
MYVLARLSHAQAMICCNTTEKKNENKEDPNEKKKKKTSKSKLHSRKSFGTCRRATVTRPLSN